MPWAILICSLVAGAGLRLAMYLQNPSLWFDEIPLALSLETPYPDSQTAPPLFRMVERFCRHWLGHSEMSLRLPSLAAGVVVLFMVAALAFRLGGPAVAALATAMAAVSPNLCRYSFELKQYETDAAVSALLLLLAAPWIMGEASRRRFLTLAISGVISIFLSTPAIFTLVGIAAAFALTKTPRRLRMPTMLMLAWGLAFFTAYRVFYGPLSASPYLKQFWAAALLTPSSGFTRIAVSAADSITVAAFGLDNASGLLRFGGVILLALGTWALVRSRGLAAIALFWVPLMSAVGASLLGKWFLVSRLVLFTVPAICVVAASGLQKIASYAPSALRARAVWVAAALALLLPLKYTFWKLRHVELQSNRTMAALCLRQTRPGDVIYIYPRAAIPWIYYSTQWEAGAGTDPNVARMIALSAASGDNSGNSASRGHRLEHEGFDRRFERSGRTELLGVSTGIQSTMGGYAGNPDPGWAENEVERMSAERSRDRFWIFAAEFQPRALDSLLETMRADGFIEEERYTGERVLVYLMRKSPSASAQ